MIEFDTVEAYARFCAELIRQGIAFHGLELPSGRYSVQLTGF